MDSITQFALGAAVGEACAGKSIKNKAIIWGGLAGSIPDLDVIIGKVFMDTVSEVAFHRGFTHSILFALLFSIPFAFLLQRLYFKSGLKFRNAYLLFFLAFFTHAILDSHTTWGTQLFWPLPLRLDFNSIFVVDPLYTLPLLICLGVIFFKRMETKRRQLWNWTGIGISTFYLALTLFSKWIANNNFDELYHERLQTETYQSRPSPFNTILWTANARKEDSIFISYYSHFDDFEPQLVRSISRNKELLEPYLREAKMLKLLSLMKSYYAVSKHRSKGILLHDLRFGILNPYQFDELPIYVFSYWVRRENGKLAVDQIDPEVRGSKESLNNLWKRFKGEKITQP